MDADEDKAQRCPACNRVDLVYAKGACPNKKCACVLYYVYCENCSEQFIASPEHGYITLEQV